MSSNVNKAIRMNSRDRKMLIDDAIIYFDHNKVKFIHSNRPKVFHPTLYGVQ